MSEFKCCYTTIRDIQKHPNPEVLRLSIATVFGFQIVIPKDRYQIGDVILYIPIDAVFKDELFETLILGPNPKIKFSNSRVRQIKIQKFYSAGLVVSKETVEEYLKQKGLKTNLKIELDKDISGLLNIEKYEPPQPKYQQVAGEKKRKKNCNNPLLHSYNGLDNLKWFPDRFVEGEDVIIQEKLHGTNCRAGLLPTQVDTFWKKIKKFFGMLPAYEFCYGSNNVELTNRADFSSNFYGEDIYGNALNQAGAKDKLQPMEVIYGEIIGEGIQKNYDYGLKNGQKKFVLFDVKIMNPDGSFKWLNPLEVEKYAKERGFDFVPILHDGKYNKQLAQELAVGDSVYCPQQKVREGVVVKSKEAYNDNSCSSQKKALKIISPVYLDKDQTDFH